MDTLAPLTVLPLFQHEAAISAETMTIHHTKHHNTYVTNLNATMEKLDAAMTAGDVSGVIALQGALKFNGGGHLNHTLFWENLCPEKKAPSGALEKAINDCFGDFEKMKAEFSAKTVGKSSQSIKLLSPMNHLLIHERLTNNSCPRKWVGLDWIQQEHRYVKWFIHRVEPRAITNLSIKFSLQVVWRLPLAQTKILCKPQLVLFLLLEWMFGRYVPVFI